VLSQEKTIKSGRLLSKVVTGRTSATPVASINKVLARYSDRYSVVVERIFKSNAYERGGVTFGLRGPQGGSAGGMQSTLVFPFSLFELISTLVSLDARAEQYYRLRYGDR